MLYNNKPKYSIQQYVPLIFALRNNQYRYTMAWKIYSFTKNWQLNKMVSMYYYNSNKLR